MTAATIYRTSATTTTQERPGETMSKRPKSPTPPATATEAEQEPTLPEPTTTSEPADRPGSQPAQTYARQLAAADRHAQLTDQADALASELQPHLHRLDRLRLAAAEALGEYRAASQAHAQATAE